MKKIIVLSTLTFAGFLAFNVQAEKKDPTLTRTSTGGSNPGSTAQAPEGSPTRAIQDLEAKTENYKTSGNLSEADKANNARLKRELLSGAFDLRELCRLSLDKHWNTLSPQSQNEFVSLMNQFLEKKAVFSKEQSKTKGNNYTVKYVGESFLDAQKSKAIAKTSIYIPKQDANVSIDYKLLKTTNGWRIFDVIVDDTSMVENYRDNFNSIISKYGYSELVSRIRKKISEINTGHS